MVDDKCAVASSAFMATDNKGKCNDPIDHVDVAELAKQVGVEPWMLDTHASDYMSPHAKAMVYSREADKTVRTADGSTCKIEGYGDIPPSCRSGDEEMKISLIGVAHIPQLRHHLVLAFALAKKGHHFCSRPGGLIINLKSSRSILLSLVGKLYAL